ncbi:inositol monophosphatase family protein [Paractinoplanes brasiliensis]|uniref:Myo-inositol-1(Or 4)-monophosphatase n=1 Tax=Paractinoplanes brasiliensis TaxID=52695 RepID=A0A4R6JAP6_9ACTN|nr:inositol monophosphatase family protein [Actinoplanes brasiliensis]TDO32783.1 myo-inositol-1(or 4)-monophosphatase [Actinoplanes brasiliensis]GID31673.1 inositol monophosphatase [Actinoplanes brasiliensis]
MDRDLTAARDLAAELAVRAGRLQLDRRSTLRMGAPKAHANDVVSDVDIASEQLIVDAVHAAWPADAIQAEEGHGRTGSSGWSWVIDPLDGTRNYVSRTGPWSVCIALYEGDRPRVAVVHEPVAGETFSAVDGGGAFLNGEPLPAPGGSTLDKALVGVSFQPNPATKERAGRVIRELLPVSGDIRRVPAALNLVYQAAGRLDGGLALDTNLWDIAAGALIAREAGVVLGGHGAEFTTELTIGAAPKLWDELAEKVRQAVNDRT